MEGLLVRAHNLIGAVDLHRHGNVNKWPSSMFGQADKSVKCRTGSMRSDYNGL
jgi:hypothetical protein